MAGFLSARTALLDLGFRYVGHSCSLAGNHKSYKIPKSIPPRSWIVGKPEVILAAFALCYTRRIRPVWCCTDTQADANPFCLPDYFCGDGSVRHRIFTSVRLERALVPPSPTFAEQPRRRHAANFDS